MSRNEPSGRQKLVLENPAECILHLSIYLSILVMAGVNGLQSVWYQRRLWRWGHKCTGAWCCGRVLVTVLRPLAMNRGRE